MQAGNGHRGEQQSEASAGLRRAARHLLAGVSAARTPATVGGLKRTRPRAKRFPGWTAKVPACPLTLLSRSRFPTNGQRRFARCTERDRRSTRVPNQSARPCVRRCYGRALKQARQDYRPHGFDRTSPRQAVRALLPRPSTHKVRLVHPTRARRQALGDRQDPGAWLPPRCGLRSLLGL